ncbi:MAG: hypothetical protein IPK10_02985 [Bacteroidetes bacterium]|nr:hypothetical protein [Bacteroidota bacterium]
MPQGIRETHPYLQLGCIEGATKLILGSFPVYECTNIDNKEKEDKREKEGTVRFFYGSNRNSLWTIYKKHIDNSIEQPWQAPNIIDSLTTRKIAISDTIISCERYSIRTDKVNGKIIIIEESSEDSALRNKTWNKEQIQSLIKKWCNQNLVYFQRCT